MMLRLTTCGALVAVEGVAHAFSLSSEAAQGALMGGVFIAAVSLLPSVNHLADVIFKMLTSGSESNLTG